MRKLDSVQLKLIVFTVPVLWESFLNGPNWFEKLTDFILVTKRRLYHFHRTLKIHCSRKWQIDDIHWGSRSHTCLNDRYETITAVERNTHFMNAKYRFFRDRHEISNHRDVSLADVLIDLTCSVALCYLLVYELTVVEDRTLKANVLFEYAQM